MYEIKFIFNFQCIYDDGFGAGVSNVKLLEGLSGCGMHVVVARLTGNLDLLLLETSTPTQKPFKKSNLIFCSIIKKYIYF